MVFCGRILEVIVLIFYKYILCAYIINSWTTNKLEHHFNYRHNVSIFQSGNHISIYLFLEKLLHRYKSIKRDTHECTSSTQIFIEINPCDCLFVVYLCNCICATCKRRARDSLSLHNNSLADT